MIFFYGLTALFIAWIWVDYYRQIDIYDREELKYLIGTFCLGCLSVFVIFGTEELFFHETPLELKGDALHDFVVITLRIGVLEELAKTIPFLIMYFLFHKQVTEPIDYLAYFCVGALGFSAVENMLYFNNHGAHIITGRAILSTVSHMFDTALVAYGVILMKFHSRYNHFGIVILFFSLAAISHGIYDFLLMFNWGEGSSGYFFAIFYFLLTLSLFAIILNNAINNSSFFSYKKVVNSDRVVKHLLIAYAIVFCIEVALNTFTQDIIIAMKNFRFNLWTSGLIIMVCALRLSRFRLIEKKWERLRIEMPFTLAIGSSPIPMPLISVRGDSFNASFISIYYEEYFQLHPLSTRKSYIQRARTTFIHKKVFPNNYPPIYLSRLYIGSTEGPFEDIVLRPKTKGVILVNQKYPIVGLYKTSNKEFHEENIGEGDLKFMEWAYITPK